MSAAVQADGRNRRRGHSLAAPAYYKPGRQTITTRTAKVRMAEALAGAPTTLVEGRTKAEEVWAASRLTRATRRIILNDDALLLDCC